MSVDLFSVNSGQPFEGQLKELQIIQAIGRSQSLPRYDRIEQISQTTLHILQGLAQHELSSDRINLVDYNWMQSGFNKLLEFQQQKEAMVQSLYKSDVAGMRQILSEHKGLPRDTAFAKTLFERCRSVEMAQVLLEYGYNVKDISYEDIKSIFRLMVFYKAFSVIDFYAKQGIEPLFIYDRESSPETIEFIGCGGSNENVKNSLTKASYLDFPHIKTAFHKFMLSDFKSQNLELFLKHCMMNNDTEGLNLIIQEFLKDPNIDNKNAMQKVEAFFMKLALKAILGNESVCLEVILKNYPVDRFSPNNQREMLSEVKKMGFFPLIDTLISNGLAVNKDELIYLDNHKAWDREKAERQYPALHKYTLFDRSLNQDHLLRYGGQSVQNLFKREQKNSILHTLWIIQEAKISLSKLPSPEKHFFATECLQKLLKSLGQRRQNTAVLCRSTNYDLFGIPRREVIHTPIEGHYGNYRSRVNPRQRTHINIDNKPILLSQIKQIKHLDYGYFIFNEYNHFWDMGDPVFSLAVNMFENLVSGAFSNAKELCKEIARFHWLLAHISPFERGSASISEVLTDAFWLFHGISPNLYSPDIA